MEINKIRRSTITRRNLKSLCDALSTLTSEQDFEDITVMQICEKAEVPRATFYNYFDDKYELLKFCFSELVDYMARQLEGFHAGSREYFEKLMELSIDFISKNRATMSRLFRASNNMGIFEIQALLSAMFLENLKKIDGDVVLKVPKELISEFYAGSIVFLVKWWVTQDMPYCKKELAEYIAILVDSSRFL